MHQTRQDMSQMMPQIMPRHTPDDAPDDGPDDAPDMPQMMHQTCPRCCPRHAPDDAPDMPQMLPQTCPRWCSRHAPDIPDICYGHHGRCPCKNILSGVKFSRLNTKTIYFTFPPCCACAAEIWCIYFPVNQCHVLNMISNSLKIFLKASFGNCLPPICLLISCSLCNSTASAHKSQISRQTTAAAMALKTPTMLSRWAEIQILHNSISSSNSLQTANSDITSISH